MTDIDVRRVEEHLYDEPEIESFTITVGRGSEFGAGGTGEKLANIFIVLSDDRERTSTEIVEDLRSELSAIRDVKVTVNQPSDGPPTGAAIIVKFLGVINANFPQHKHDKRTNLFRDWRKFHFCFCLQL